MRQITTGTLLLLAAASAPATAQRTHKLPATPATVAYGHYWAETPPVLRIASGDVIDVETMITNRPDRLEAAGVRPEEVQQSLRDIVAQVTDRGPGGHILTGPVYVEGADSGDVLEVEILSVDLAIPYGYNGCSGFVRELCTREGAPTRIIRLDGKRMTAEFAPGIVVPLRPFFGSMGVAPPRSSGRVSSNPPSTHAGNLDNKELVAGTTLYIPVHVAGALFEVGDGHAAQGDGEVDQTAIETSLRGRLRLTVRKDMRLDWPVGETPTHWITMGMDTSLTTATRTAVREMVKLIERTTGLTQMEAYQLASIAADLRITQLVDGNVGAHMMVAKSLLAPARARR
ncbi:MAG TPA: acetamidase/formamidase family protein [Gemmatimonadaceae bacterium]|nr:acetamidase/formamidase family protein [Gemmatimonadaceae bacterium]